MFTIQDYIDQLKIDKQNLVDNLITKGITASSDETFTSLVPKVLDITILNAQSKSETITTNTTTTFTPDTGYNALSSIEITTNVQPTLQSKSETITTNTTTTISPDDGYDGLSSVSVTTNVVPSNFYDTLNKDTFSRIFGYWLIKEIPSFTLNSNVTSLLNCFNGFYEMIKIGYFNTINVTNFSSCFSGCNKLQDLPLLDFSSATTLTSVFSACFAFNNTSLDNILQMCAGASNYTGTKTLQYLFNSNMSSYYPSSTIQGLAHYQDFLDAGWTIGW